jgi:hypothetical protein
MHIYIQRGKETQYYLRGAKATFELTRQLIEFLEFLVDFFVAVLQREIKRKNGSRTIK